MLPPAFCTAAAPWSILKRNRLGRTSTAASTTITPLRKSVTFVASPQCAVPMRQKLDADGVEYITLESFIKVQGVTSTGGHAKIMVTAGQVSVNGQIETRRGRKLRQGDVVLVDNQSLAVDFM